jgi:hypothetical protein
METLTVYNSSRRTWILALSGAVLIAVALDLLVWHGVVAALAERVYEGDEVLEARERVWAGMMLVTGSILILWSVIWAIRIRPVLIVAQDGLHLALRGPFRPLDVLDWDSIKEVISQPVADDGSLLSSLTIVFASSDPAHSLPQNPWGARWTGSLILRLLTSDWSVRAEVVSTVSNHFLSAKQNQVEPVHDV